MSDGFKKFVKLSEVKRHELIEEFNVNKNSPLVAFIGIPSSARRSFEPGLESWNQAPFTRGYHQTLRRKTCSFLKTALPPLSAGYKTTKLLF